MMLCKVKKAFSRHRGAIVVGSSLAVLFLLVQGCFYLDKTIGSQWFWSSVASEYKVLLDEKGNYVLGPSRESLLVDKGDTEISLENLDNRGATVDAWFLNQTDPSMINYVDRPVLVEGFATAFSHFPGDTISFKIDTAIRKDVLRNLDHHEMCKIEIDLQIYRLGYYKGVGAKLMDAIRFTSYAQHHMMHKYTHHFYSNTKEGSISRHYLHSQVKCKVTRNSVVDCDNWKETVTWTIPPHNAQFPATTGIYVAMPKIINQDGCGIEFGESDDGNRRGLYIPFVVKHPHMKPYFESAGVADTAAYDEDEDTQKRIIFRTADMTWAAYNKYGGWNLYQGPGGGTYASSDATSSSSVASGGASLERARAVSYNRPYHNRLPFPLGQAQNYLFGTEYAMLFFLERLGYNLAYISCEDSEVLYRQGYFRGEGPPQSHPKEKPVLLSVGHDEYWTEEMVLAYAQAREQGSHLAFFSGNEMFWRVAWARDKARTGRVVLCNKDTIDMKPRRNSVEWTGTFADSRQPKSGKLFEEGLEEIPHRMTGQYFYVNAYRSDPLRVPSAMGKMRFWRNTYVRLRHEHTEGAWQSYAGVLGYEWDATATTLCSHQRPPGIFAVSHSRFTIQNQLVQEYGAKYKGSGVVLHQVTMYRHQPRLLNEVDVDKRDQSLRDKPTSLVFSAGTVQWAWALSTMHDGDHITGHHFDQNSTSSSRSGKDLRWFGGGIPPADPEIQQATMNLLADMGCDAATATNLHRASRYGDTFSQGKDKSTPGNKTRSYLDSMLGNRQKASAPVFPYVSPNKADDSTPPVSAIHGMTLSESRSLSLPNGGGNSSSHGGAGTLLTVKGVAQDVGGGAVSSVEVSLDYGKTWQRATVTNIGKFYEPVNGRAAHWTLQIPLRAHDQEAGASYVVKEATPELWGTCRSYLNVPRAALPHSALKDCSKIRRTNSSDDVHIVVISRAVDDSGWIQPVPSETEVRDMAKINRRTSCSKQFKTVQSNIKVLCLPYIYCT